MADLYENDDDPRNHASWIEWTIALMKRGLKPIGPVVIHGPHPPADYQWGEAECEYLGSGCYEVVYQTRNGSGWGTSGLRVQEKDGDDNCKFPKLQKSKMPKTWAEEIDALEKRLRKFRKEHDC